MICDLANALDPERAGADRFGIEAITEGGDVCPQLAGGGDGAVGELAGGDATRGTGRRAAPVLTTAVLSSGVSIEAILSQPRRDQTGSSSFMIICQEATMSFAVSVSPFWNVTFGRDVEGVGQPVVGDGVALGQDRFQPLPASNPTRPSITPERTSKPWA